jgi:hypothetical protein
LTFAAVIRGWEIEDFAPRPGIFPHG